MYHFVFHASPDVSHKESTSFGGAYVNCWIDRPTSDEAEIVARQLIRNSGWVDERLEECREVIRSDYSNNQDGLVYFDQAVSDKEVLVFHRYPMDDNICIDLPSDPVP
jgi:hypothetical protein